MAGLFNFSALVGNAVPDVVHYDPQPALDGQAHVACADQAESPVASHWSIGADGALESHWEPNAH